MLEVRLIGAFEIKCDGKPATISSRAGQSLFAYLILNGDTPHRREKLAGMFWPDVADKQARAYLRYELWRIRKALTAKSNVDFLITDNINISFHLSADDWLDVAQLKNLSEDASIDELINALSVFQGELLPGFYEDWITVEREHLQSLYEQRITRLLGMFETEQRWNDILEWAERWISVDSASEAAYRALMVAHDALGDRAKVTATYERCVQALRELDLEPSEQTRAIVVKRTSKLNIPIPLTSFIGREKELRQIADLLSKSRLVTLTGSGGVGKTRLSIQVVADVLDSFPDGVWFLDLAPVINSTLVPTALATLLKLRESAELSVSDLLINYFRTRRGLIIFDNCEHLIDASAQLIHLLLTSCEHLSVLATSREALHVSGETPYRVPSLEILGSEMEPGMEILAKIESVQLFIQRASAISPGFKIDPQNAFVTAQICRRLDGIPLAIELAAARINMLSVQQILARLDDRFRLLTGGARTALPRQQTLRATIDWSYDLLSENERLFLRRLAVFAGGWTLELAEQICADETILQDEILDMLAHLVDKSLVAVDEARTGKRYRILETVRQYAREKLFESGEGASMRNKHRDEFLAIIEKVEPELIRGQQKKWMDVLEAEHDNLRAALSWSFENENAEQALRFCGALSFFWDRRRHFTEAVLACKEALACAKQNEGLKMTTWYAFVLTASALFINVTELTWSDPSIRMLLEQAREIYATINSYTSTGPVWASFLLNEAYVDVNDISSAERCVSELYEKVKTSGYPWGVALAKWSMSDLSLRKGDMVSALALRQESSELFMQIEDVWAAKQVSGFLLWHKVMRGEFEDGIRLAKQDLVFYEDYGDPGGIASCFVTLGIIAREQGQYESARRYFTDAINLGSETGDLGGIVFAGERDAYLLFLEGKLEAAHAKYQDVLTRLKDVPNDNEYGFAHARSALVSLREDRFAEARKELAIGLEVLQKTDPEVDIYIAYYGLGELARLEGRYSEAIEFYRASLNALNLGHIYIGFPDPLDGLAKTKLMQSRLEDAARLFGASEGLRKKMAIVIHNVDQPDYDKHIQLLREKMNTDELKSAWEAGRQMSLDEAVAFALNELQ